MTLARKTPDFSAIALQPLSGVPSVADLLGPRYTKEYQEAFPDLDPPYRPFGYLVLLQLRMPKKKVGSLILPDSEPDVERYRVQSMLVRGFGPACFKDRQTGADWVEGPWCKLGDFVRGPMYGGDRFDIEFTDAAGQKNKTTFCFAKEADLIALVSGDPLNVTTS